MIAAASDPYIAVERIAREVPDVITLDIEMPRMDGINFLEKIMAQHPIPVVIARLSPVKDRKAHSRHWKKARWISSAQDGVQTVYRGVGDSHL